jgi:hypothetical protein
MWQARRSPVKMVIFSGARGLSSELRGSGSRSRKPKHEAAVENLVPPKFNGLYQAGGYF